MGPPSYMRSVIDLNVIIPVYVESKRNSHTSDYFVVKKWKIMYRNSESLSENQQLPFLVETVIHMLMDSAEKSLEGCTCGN